MKTACFVVILLFTTLIARAADTVVTRLINSIYLEIVDPDARFYYLVDSAKSSPINRYITEDLINDAGPINNIPFDELIFNSQHDTTALCWKSLNLIKAKCIDRQQLPNYSVGHKVFRYLPYNTKDSILRKMSAQNIIPILVMPGMTKTGLEKAKKKAIKIYENRPIEEKSWYCFSKPIFSNNRAFALISLNNNVRGCLYIFKLVNGSWIKLYKFHCWVT